MNLLKKIYINEVELYGEKDIYYYFNLINEKFENNTFNSSEVEGTIMSTEPLTYKIRSNSFLESDPKLPEYFKTSIKVVLQKKKWHIVYYLAKDRNIYNDILHCFNNWLCYQPS